MRSLRMRIILLIICVGVIPSYFLKNALVESYLGKQIEVEIQDMQAQMNILANHLVMYRYLREVQSDVVNAELEQLSNLYDGRVMIINQNFKIIKDTYGVQQNNYIVSEKVINCFAQGKYNAEYDAENEYIEMVTPIFETVLSIEGEEERISSPSVAGVILISFSTRSFVITQEYIARQGTILMSIIFILLTAFAIVISKVLVMPLEQIHISIKQVTDGVEERVDKSAGYVETANMIKDFNGVLARNKVLDESRQEFVANVSHELKTPITSIKVLADSLIAQGDVPNELYREFMVDIAAEIEREDQIIQDLLSLVKFDKKVAAMNVELISMEQLLERILKRLLPIAKKKNVEITLEVLREVTAEIDEVKLSLALTNLIENAIKYNNVYGKVRVKLDADHQYAIVQVTDTGLGIPKDSLEHIYERFYRVDKSHSREIGGTGLGLAITKSTIKMHQGSVEVESEEGVGTSFTVKIPLIYIERARYVKKTTRRQAGHKIPNRSRVQGYSKKLLKK